MDSMLTRHDRAQITYLNSVVMPDEPDESDGTTQSGEGGDSDDESGER